MSTCSVTQILHYEAVPTKRRKRPAIVLLAVIGGVIGGMVAYGLLKQKDEPKYQNRYLSEWFEEYEAARSEVDLPRRAEAEAAVRSIGTNALPCFLKWIANEPPGQDIERRRACRGFDILGTDAVSAVPDLLAIMTGPTSPEYHGFTPGLLDPYTAAAYALQSIGGSAIPTFKAALADPNPMNRCKIVRAFNSATRVNGTNLYRPTLVAALNDPDARVRHEAEYVLICDFGSRSNWEYFSALFTNAPAQ